MKRIFSLALCLLMCACVLCSCSGGIDEISQSAEPGEDSPYGFVSGKTAVPTAYTSYKTSVTEFTLKALKAANQHGGAEGFSPAALYGQLALLQNAAAGNTQKEIKKLTGKNLSSDELNECNAYFFSRLASLGKTDERTLCEISGDMFFDQGTVVSQEYLQKNADYYRQGIFKLDLADSGASGKIAAYLSDKYGCEASELSNITTGGDIALAGSFTLSDNWLTGGEAVKAEFGGKKDVSFIKSVERRISGSGFSGIIKDYKNAPCRFIALLPDKGGVSSLLDKLTYESLSEAISSAEIVPSCEVYLPQFSVSTNADLKPQLKAMGIKEAFDGGDFSGLSYGAKATVCSVTQRAKFSVKAGASGKKTALKAESTLRLNKPFIYMVIDNESNIPLAAGVVADI